ncbi:MAG: Rnf-Nqr domain containing protein [Candidatus Riflebacteria bacterium]|nr:Rnf-Nqr domain containing protein [Candidatus Riflebacteria bacterium]
MNYLKIMFKGIFSSNPVFVLALGLCSTLAVTGRADTAFFMGVMVGITTIFSTVIVSALRYKIPFKFRLMSYMLIIITAVISVEQLLRAYYPDMARTLGQYVGLIVTNCVIMGRCEAFAVSHGPKETFFDAIGVSIGYCLVLLGIAFFREILGNGTLWGLYVMPSSYVPCRVFNSPSGAFLTFAAMLYLVNLVKDWFKG